MTAPVRNAQIRAAAARGVSLTTLAGSYCISRQRVWQIVHPEQDRAQAAVQNALAAGKLIRPGACEGCGRNIARAFVNRRYRLQSHHDDYSKPLQVRWLCRRCHCIADAQRNQHRFQVGGEPRRYGIQMTVPA